MEVVGYATTSGVSDLTLGFLELLPVAYVPEGVHRTEKVAEFLPGKLRGLPLERCGRVRQDATKNFLKISSAQLNVSLQ